MYPIGAMGFHRGVLFAHMVIGTGADGNPIIHRNDVLMPERLESLNL